MNGNTSATEGVYTPGHQNKEPEPGKAVAVNNARWLRPLNYIDFLREIGTQFNINTMLRAECFKQRMEREGGLTMFELNYMLMQSYDFMVMARDFDVKIEFGGNDQWSNIIGGVDLTLQDGRQGGLRHDLLAFDELRGSEDG